MEFTVLTDKQEITEAHDRVVGNLTTEATNSKSFKAYKMTGIGYWLGKHGIFFYTADPATILEKHFWDVFGTREPSWDREGLVMPKGNKDWILEINPPFEGENWRLEGQFLKDDDGKVYYTHSSNLSMPREYTGPAFYDWYQENVGTAKWVSVGNKHGQFVISAIDSKTFVEDVAGYVKAVRRFRDTAETEEPTEFWMIRAGGRIDACRGDCQVNHDHVAKTIAPGWDWPNQKKNHFAGIHYYDIDLSTCTETDGTLSEEKVKEKVDEIRRGRRNSELSVNEWAACYKELKAIFSVNKTGGKCRIFVVGKNKELLGIGDANSQYEYKEGIPNPHAINVDWIETTKRDLPEEFWHNFNQSIKDMSREEYDLIMAKSKHDPTTTMYAPLAAWLDQQQRKKIIEITLDDINLILHEKLPPSATSKGQTASSWWGNNPDNHPQAKNGWLAAGYKTVDVAKTLPDSIRFEYVGTANIPGVGNILHQDCDKWKPYYNVLKRKRNMIFYGPPGTGKTWTARQLAECLCKENGSAFQADLASVLQTGDPGTFEERLIEQLEKDANAEGFSFEKRPDASALQKNYSLKGDGGEEIRVGIHSSEEKSKPEPLASYFQVGNSEIAWFKENPDNRNFVVFFKKGIESFVCIPFETEQDFSKFGGAGDGTGGWDPTGEGKHNAHNLKFDTSRAYFDMNDGSTNRPDDKKDKDVTECLNTWGFDSCVFSVTFHPSYSYEDFVEGFRPKIQDDRVTLGTGGVVFPYHVDGQPVGSSSMSQYELAEGIFRIACDHARSHPGRKTVLLIDEINRGNIPKIFGELITLIEKDKRSSEYAVRLAYSKERFFVPYNLYIIGTMNTADKSLVQMDDALKRRFAFEELMPDMDVLKDHLSAENVNDAGDYIKILENINKKILNHSKTAMKQFRDRQVGHSYFWDIKDDGDLKFVIKYEVIPLLQDYFYNDYEILRKILGTGEKDYRVIGKDNRPTDLVKNGTMKIKDNQYNENAGTPQNLRSVLLDLDPASTATASNVPSSNDTDSNDTDSNDTDSNDTASDGTNNN